MIFPTGNLTIYRLAALLSFGFKVAVRFAGQVSMLDMVSKVVSLLAKYIMTEHLLPALKMSRDWMSAMVSVSCAGRSSNFVTKSLVFFFVFFILI